MTIREVLDIIELSNIDKFTLNGVPYSLQYISNTLGDTKVLKLNIYTEQKELNRKDIIFSVDDRFLHDVTIEEVVDIILPNTSTYVSIVLNFKIREEVLL